MNKCRKVFPVYKQYTKHKLLYSFVMRINFKSKVKNERKNHTKNIKQKQKFRIESDFLPKRSNCNKI